MKVFLFSYFATMIMELKDNSPRNIPLFDKEQVKQQFVNLCLALEKQK